VTSSPSLGSQQALSGFLISGLLTSCLGAFLPVWGYHLTSDFITAGNYFLCMNVGLLASVHAAHALLARRGIAFVLTTACALACVSFLGLALSCPPGPALGRAAGLLGLGVSAGLLNTAVFHAISPLYRQDRAATVTLAGALYGLGCLITALLAAGTYYVYTAPSILILFAVIPGLCAGLYARVKFPRDQGPRHIPARQVLEDFKNPGAVLFTLLLFFQFGNEWSIAGWLPLFLIRRLGISPEASLFLLAFYWASLLVGRLAAQALLQRMSHAKLLLSSVSLSLLGCVILTTSADRFGAGAGILFVGSGFASIYPLVVERIGRRFSYYHPGLYNGIFSFAFTGGLLAPCALGYLAHFGSIRVIMLGPLLGTSMVFALALLILLESRLAAPPPSGRAARA
jgi:FHS family glucose/mannose:H+ symporter-like MFS transporter